ncbi:MAG: DUF364 domain-containing protein [Corynebacterium flavescens]|uniref:DUF364 domain-containing protein n=1 Tax=Corynebacterium flavescens TaxID=28028 RepID=UPI0026492237|nr:DUF364 domain-containing protein [Corynebacterium flavescens]MDN6530794.1 DUF364 domain-containing protein [Corynebacterium flavescens]
MSAWDLYDELIDAIPRDITVVRAAQGPRWTRIYTNNPSCGIALTMIASSRPAQMMDDYVGIPVRAIAQLSKSWNFSEASFGLAALNSYYSTASVAAEHGFVIDPAGAAAVSSGGSAAAGVSWDRVFSPFSERVTGKKVAVIGHFPFAPKALHSAAEFYMLERQLNEGDYPDSAAEYLLPECDFVFISGSAFVNKTAPRLIELSRQAQTILLGPSTPLAPVLLEEYGVDQIDGVVSDKPLATFEALGEEDNVSSWANGHIVERGAGVALSR